MGETLKNLEDVYSKWEKSQPDRQQKINGVKGGYEQMIEKGRQAWRSRFKDGAPPPPTRNTKQKRRTARNNEYRSFIPSSSLNYHIGVFKTGPTIQPCDDSAKRPYMGRCPSCLPKSRMMFFEEAMKAEGFENILDLETLQGPQNGKPWLARQFSPLIFYMERGGGHVYPDVSLEVLTSPRIADAIRASARADLDAVNEDELDPTQLKKLEKRNESRAASILKQMAATFSFTLTRTTGLFLHYFLGALVSCIMVPKGQVRLLKKVEKKGIPVIYLPTHRSHLDYILVSWILWNLDLKGPHVAAGDNLQIPFFGYLIRSLGGYFIRRKLDQGNGKKDVLYRAVLHQYMEEVLKKRQNLEIYIEGGRTRSGKSLYPKSGLLSVVIDVFMGGEIEDVCLVPLGISYDKIMDGNFVSEQMGEPKNKESFFRASKAIWKVMRQGFGQIRVDFGQPFSLKEYLEVCGSFGAYENHSSRGVKPSNPRVGSLSSISSTDGISEERRCKVQNLAELVIHGCQNWQAVMSSHIVAFTLLTRHRQGVKQSLLVITMEWVRDELHLRGRDVGFSGQMEDVISHAAHILGSHLVQKSQVTKEGEDSEAVITPTIDLPHVFELAYYANTVTCTFALESVLAFAIVSETSYEDWLKLGHEDTVSVSRANILQKAVDLCHLLQFEFIFKLPSSTWESVLIETIDRFLSSEILTNEDHGSTEERPFTTRVSKNFSWSDESDDSEEESRVDNTRYLVNLDSDYSMDKLRFLLSVCAPIMECYYTVACQVEKLLDNPMQETQFIKSAHKVAKERVQSGFAVYSESASYDTVRNAVMSFQRINLIEKIDGISASNKSLLLLQGDEVTKDCLDLLLETLSACVTLPQQCRFSNLG